MMNQSEKELIEALEQLDDESTQALMGLIKESPELLREILDEYGYLDDSVDDDSRFIANEDSVSLTEAQAQLGQHLSDKLDSPKTLSQILEDVGSKNSEFRQQYSSAQYRSWLGDQLAALVDAGKIGRFKKGRTVHFTQDPKTAVRHWGRINERFSEDISIGDVKTIASETGMPSSVVRNAIRQINDD